MVDNKIKTIKKLNIFSGWNLFGTVSLLAALMTGIGVPIWQNYWVDQSDLSIEINGISREAGPNIGIRLNSHPELSILLKEAKRSEDEWGLDLAENGEDYDRIKVGSRLLSKKQIKRLISYLQERKDTLPDQIKKTKETINEINGVTLSNLINLSDFVYSSKTDREYRKLIEKESPTEKELKELQKNFTKRYETRLQVYEEDLRSLQLNFGSAKAKAEELLSEVSKKESFFTVNSVLINSGKGSISIKKPALLRVYIGTGTYIDFNLELQKYEESAEVAANGTRIVSLRSKIISKLPDEDQGLVDTYWGQSVHSILFIQDINGQIISSNRIPFSEGLYQKVIFDKLAEKASEAEFFRQSP